MRIPIADDLTLFLFYMECQWMSSQNQRIQISFVFGWCFKLEFGGFKVCWSESAEGTNAWYAEKVLKFLKFWSLNSSYFWQFLVSLGKNIHICCQCFIPVPLDPCSSKSSPDFHFDRDSANLAIGGLSWGIGWLFFSADPYIPTELFLLGRETFRFVRYF